MELLRHTRHPASTSSDHDGVTCGTPTFFESQPDEPFRFGGFGQLTPEARAAALRQLGMLDGTRYNHDRCPIDPGADSDAENCVTVLDAGIFCHRCAGRDKHYRPGLAAGFYPLNGDGDPLAFRFDQLARSRIHWTHAQLELSHAYPHLAESLLAQAYRKTLEQLHGESDPRTKAVFNRDLDFVRGNGLWLDSTHLSVTTVDNDAANGLPYCQYVQADNEGEVVIAVDPVRRSQVKNRVPRDYRPVRPFIGISFAPNDEFIPVQRQPLPQHPIELLGEPMPDDEAFAKLQTSFPRLDRRYLEACLAAAICGEARSGMPPAIACTGPSGSGKEQHIRLAASFVGDDIVKLTLTDDDEKLRRQIGTSIVSGHRFLVFDEFGKTAKLVNKLKPILEISNQIHWRPLFQSHHVATPVRAAFFYPCVRFPDFLSSSQEFNRRVRHVHLYRQLPDWGRSSGGDTAAWRDRSKENARIANSILTHVWRICHDYDFRFIA